MVKMLKNRSYHPKSTSIWGEYRPSDGRSKVLGVSRPLKLSGRFLIVIFLIKRYYKDNYVANKRYSENREAEGKIM